MEEKDVVSSLTCICIVGIEVSQLFISVYNVPKMDSHILAFENVLFYFNVLGDYLVTKVNYTFEPA
jgi:hypothetical protein